MQHTPRLLLLSALTVGAACTATFVLSGGLARAESPDTRTPDVAPFHALSVGGAFEVAVAPADAPKVVLHGPTADLERVAVTVEDGVLRIRRTGRPWAPVNVRVEVFAPRLDRLDVSGAVTLTARDLKGPRLAVEASGASELSLAGAVERLTLDVSGASDVKALGLAADDARVEVSGASEVKLRAERSLTVDASGASDVRYAGQPATVEVDRSGASDVAAI